MLIIKCPFCGEREQIEFSYGGEAHIARPTKSDAMSDEDWASYVFLRTNPKGLFAERWVHSAGCRKWFNMVRNTATDEILAIYLPGEKMPDVTTDIPNTPSGEANIGSGNDAAKLVSPREIAALKPGGEK